MQNPTAVPTELWRLSAKEKHSVQKAWVDALEDRLGINELYTPSDAGLDLVIEPKVAALKQIFTRLRELLKNDNIDGLPRNACVATMVEQSLNFARADGEEDAVKAAALLGVLDNPNDVHIHNIGGVQDLASRAIGFLRGDSRATESTCWEIRDNLRRDFEIMKVLMGVKEEVSRFIGVDIREIDFDNRPGVDNYWLAENTGQLTGHMIQRVIELHEDEMPEGIAILPCTCCCYVEGGYPYADKSKALISLEEWKYLTSIRDSFHDENGLNQRIMKIVDCLRVQQINEGNSSLRARVQNLHEHRNAIIIRAA